INFARPSQSTTRNVKCGSSWHDADFTRSQPSTGTGTAGRRLAFVHETRLAHHGGSVMCGIAGAVDRTGAAIDDIVIGAMTRVLAHRGPDGEGVWIERNVGLGHRRLAIRDLTDAGRQPIADPSGRIVVTYNGEIYNDAEL